MKNSVRARLRCLACVTAKFEEHLSSLIRLVLCADAGQETADAIPEVQYAIQKHSNAQNESEKKGVLGWLLGAPVNSL